jgi:hypothetical protein
MFRKFILVEDSLMRTWHASQLAVFIAFALAGCEPVQRGSDDPMPTTGPNQVVLKVPNMT